MRFHTFDNILISQIGQFLTIHQCRHLETFFQHTCSLKFGQWKEPGLWRIFTADALSTKAGLRRANSGSINSNVLSGG